MVDSASQTSVSLLGRLRQSPHDQPAWHDFAQRYGRRIYMWCRRWGLQEADSADVTQLVLLKLAREMPTFEYDPSRSFRAWLKTLAHHAWHDLVTNRHRAVLAGGAGDEALAELAAPDDLAARLEETYDRELLEAAMVRVRLRVEPKTWEAFRLTTEEGQPGADVAGQLGMRITSVYKARSNVIKMLQEEIRYLEGGVG